jgi:hypothetical protein
MSTGNVTDRLFPEVETVMVPAGATVEVPALAGTLWHAPYRFSGEGGRFLASLIYEGSASCIRCGRSMGCTASVSSTRICGSCDMGKSGTDEKARARYQKAKAEDSGAAWRNVAKVYQFASDEDWARFKKDLFARTLERMKALRPTSARPHSTSTPRVS